MGWKICASLLHYLLLLAQLELTLINPDISTPAAPSTENFNDVSQLAIIDLDHDNSIYQPKQVDISAVLDFLGCRTPNAWLKAALADLPTLLQDHANCEKKAAGTAMNLIFRYMSHTELQRKLAQLIREEMLHYEQVMGLMAERGQAWQHIPAGRYAAGMLKHKRSYEPAAMVDVLIIGAFIEARSCERFAALAEVIDDERLAKYYRYLLKSESRHFEDYLMLAQSISETPIAERVAFFRQIENDLISTPDSELRFHSGLPDWLAP